MKQKIFTTVRDEEHVISEAEGRRSREQVVVSSPAVRLPAGTVLGKLTATGEYAPLALSGTTGAENAAVILGPTVIPSSPVADQRVSVHARDCEVNGHKLAWPTGITNNQKAAAEAALAQQGIIVRY